MEVRCISILVAFVAVLNVAATHATRNFVVTAPTQEFAVQVAERAEECRVELAKWWLGYELRPWFRPCKVHVTVGQMGSGGATTFAFDRGQVGDWNMNVQGSPERILDSVIPHEVSHTIFACFFLRPLPRWADEGAATIIEHPVERERQKTLTKQIVGTSQLIPLRELFAIQEYPQDIQKVLNLYAEGYTLCEWLVFHHGQEKYLSFLNAAHQEGWDRAISTHYGYDNVEAMEQAWHRWIQAGFPKPSSPEKSVQPQVEVAQASKPRSQPKKSRTTEETVSEGEIRGQAPDEGTVRGQQAPKKSAEMPTRSAKGGSTSQPAMRKRRVEAPAPRATTGDVVLGELGDIHEAVVALNPGASRRSRSASEGWQGENVRQASGDETDVARTDAGEDERDDAVIPPPPQPRRSTTGHSRSRLDGDDGSGSRVAADEGTGLRPAPGSVRTRIGSRQGNSDVGSDRRRSRSKSPSGRSSADESSNLQAYRRSRPIDWEASAE